jgi:hypothetical protein
MKLNKIVEEALSASAVELLNLLAAHALAAAPEQGKSMYSMPVEQDNWNSTMVLMREIFDAEVLISGESDWVAFRILQSFGVNQGQLSYQFTPTFTDALSTS